MADLTFSLPDCVVHNESSVRGTGPLEIVTPAKQWAYAVAFPIPEAAFESGLRALAITLQVPEGRVGVGILTHDLYSYLGAQGFCEPKDGKVVMELPLAPHQDYAGCWLMLRNAAVDSLSRCTVYSIAGISRAASRSGAAQQAIMYTNIPGREPISFSRYYDEFASYYPNCELETKRWWVEHARRDWVIFDCGANVGYYSILFSRLAPHGTIHAFEPTATIEMLRDNLVENGVHNVEVHEVALGAFSGRRVEPIYRIWGHEPDYLDVEFLSIDDFVRDHGITRLDAIKIDVDSFDFEVLVGAEQTLARFDPYVVVELNEALSKRQHSNAEAFDWLSQRGYKQALVLGYENYVLKRRGGVDDELSAHRFELVFGPAAWLAGARSQSKRPE